ncbi:MAG: diaminopimelate decarboxylase [Bdellovibrionales bacterium]
MAFRLKNQAWTMLTRQGELALSEIVQSHTRPFYLYNLEDALTRAEHFLRSELTVHYAMKANSDPRLLRELAAKGVGVDVVSLGEMQKAIACGFSPKRLIFSGVAKDREELEAALHAGIFQINVESFEELKLLNEICIEKKTTADVALRLNIQLTAPTHEHVQTATPDSKFGFDMAQLPEVLTWLKNAKNIRVKGIATHIGSQIEDLEIFEMMAKKMGTLYKEFRSEGLPLERLDLGGGLGIDYQTDGAEDLERADKYLQRLKSSHGTDAQVLVEPGRFLVARMGVMLAKVIYIKKTSTQNFAILNAGMNFLMRPALYDSYHRISAITPARETDSYTVVGPICESTDKFAVNREMSKLQRGDWVAIFDVGAYGATMAHTYNESPLPKQWSWLNGTWEVS